MHHPTGHTQAAFTRLEDILLPVLRTAIFLVGCNRLRRNGGECICGSRLKAGAPLDHATHSPWNPSAHHQSAKSFRQNQAHVRWHATEHISPAHTQTSPQ
ncbi:hypothetical protein O181_105715 [Austropuccinia psidii MF-1]|uniref:Uncharacterized protein n=1 Tax=Austropuccinia psidii MF-1 TaxID=1389203 RepID=A0A9Q3PLX0_9BASI|nr:hypothetical protein [Austropuccinia psidii MF-1]